MIAVNPTRVGPFFTAKDVDELVQKIEAKTQNLIQIVNFNVENWQYILTGYNSNLEAFRVICDTLRVS